MSAGVRKAVSGPALRGALIGVGAVTGCWMLEALEDLFTHDPSSLGRQAVQGLPAFTQAHPLQEPVLLHLQQRIRTSAHV